MSLTDQDFEYDVALSFAGDYRDYVEQVADHLRAAKVRVFYDDYEKAALWGKDLYLHLDDIYQNRAQYCVMFISRSYKDKLWTNHERQSAKAPKRQSAQARAFGEREEYILPARFDDTEIPGVRPTVGYIDLCEFSPQEFAGMVLEKIGKLSPATSDVDSKTVRPGGHRIPRLGRRQFNPYEESQEFISNLVEELKNRCDNIATDDVSASLFNRDGRSCLRVVYAGNAVYSLDVWMGGFVGDCSVSFFGIRGPIRNIGGSISAWGELEFDRENLAPVLVLNDFGLLGHPSGKTRLHLSETVEAIWEVICESLENAD